MPPLVVLALALEGTDVVRTRCAASRLVYLAVVNSILGLLLLGKLVRAGGAGAGASIFFLMPPVTAVMAWLVLGETFDRARCSAWWSPWSVLQLPPVTGVNRVTAG